MRPVAAIIEPAFDLAQASRDITKAHIEYQDGERALQASEQKTESLREAQQRRRIELGRKLIEAKAGVKHGGWLPFLEKLGIAARTAQEWMVEAGFLEESKNAANQDAAHLPSRIAAGIDKRSTPPSAQSSSGGGAYTSESITTSGAIDAAFLVVTSHTPVFVLADTLGLAWHQPATHGVTASSGLPVTPCMRSFGSDIRWPMYSGSRFAPTVRLNRCLFSADRPEQARQSARVGAVRPRGAPGLAPRAGRAPAQTPCPPAPRIARARCRSAPPC